MRHVHTLLCLRHCKLGFFEQAANKSSSTGGLPPSPAKSAAEWQAVGATASPTAVKARRRKKSKVQFIGCAQDPFNQLV